MSHQEEVNRAREVVLEIAEDASVDAMTRLQAALSVGNSNLFEIERED